MKIFLAGENGKKRLIRKFANVNIFSGGGESRHWLNTPLIEVNENATVSGRRVLQKYGKRSQADCMGGIVPEVDNDIIPCRSNNGREPLERGQIQTDWGYG